MLRSRKSFERFHLGSSDDKMNLSINQGQERPMLSTEEREQFRPIFRQDYHLLASLLASSKAS